MSLLHPRHISATAGGKRGPGMSKRVSKTTLVAGRRTPAAADIKTPLDYALDEVGSALHGGLWPHVPRVTEALLTVGTWLARRGSTTQRQRVRRGSVARVQEQRLCRGEPRCSLYRAHAAACATCLHAPLCCGAHGVRARVCGAVGTRMWPQPGLACAKVRSSLQPPPPPPSVLSLARPLT